MKKLLSILAVLALVAACVLAFASCGDDEGTAQVKYSPNKDYESAAAGLYCSGYKTRIQDDDPDCIEVIGYSKADEGDFIEIYYCSDAEKANEIYEEIKKDLSKYEELDNELTYECNVEGTIAWIGTTGAVEASYNKTNEPFDSKYLIHEPNEDPEEAEKALNEAGYKVVNTIKDGVGIIAATKGEDTITIQYCADEAAAEKAYEQLETLYEAVEKIADELGEDVGYEIGISGKMVWSGTPDAISAAA